MLSLAVVCLIFLAVIGIWYYFQYSGKEWPPENKNVQNARLLRVSNTLTPELKGYLKELEGSELVGVLVEDAEKMASSLLEEIAAFFAAEDRSAEIMALTQHPKADVRAKAAEVLGYIPLDGRGKALVETLGDKNEEVRLAVVASLTRLRDPSTAVPLAEALGNPGKLVPARVAEVLLALGDCAVLPLINELKNSSPQGEALICEMLGQIGDVRSLPVLMEILKTSVNEKSRAAAAQALGNISGQGNVQALLGALKDSASKVRSAAAEALGQLGSQEALPALTGAEQEEEDWNAKAVIQAAINKLSS